MLTSKLRLMFLHGLGTSIVLLFVFPPISQSAAQLSYIHLTTQYVSGYSVQLIIPFQTPLIVNPCQYIDLPFRMVIILIAMFLYTLA